MLRLFILLETSGFLFVSERIFTVMTVIIIIFSAVILMLVRVERKLNRMEKQLRDGEK